MSDLQQALWALADARPDPAKVEALTAATLHRREHPWADGEVIDHMTPMPREIFRCILCGALIPWDGRPYDTPNTAPRRHIDWHNTLERRLRKLEGAA